MTVKTVEQKADELLEYVRSQEKFLVGVKAANPSSVKLDPKECRSLCKKAGLVYHEGLEKRVLGYRFTDPTVDHYNEVITPKGVDLKIYKGNPIILMWHNGRSYPVGKAIKVWHEKGENGVTSVDAWVLFYDDEIDPTGVSEDAFTMAVNGGMTKGSIGFTCKPEDIRRPTEKEMEFYGIDKRGWIYDKITLLEFSLVSIPANPNAGQIPTKSFRHKTLQKLMADGDSEEMIRKYIGPVVIEGMDYDESKVEYVDEKLVPDIDVGNDSVQSIVFSKEFSKDDIHTWLCDNNLKHFLADEGANIATQREVEDFEPKSFRTVQIIKGIQAIVGKPKEAPAEPESNKSEMNIVLTGDLASEENQKIINDAQVYIDKGVKVTFTKEAKEETEETDLTKVLKAIEGLNKTLSEHLQPAAPKEQTTDDVEELYKGLFDMLDDKTEKLKQ